MGLSEEEIIEFTCHADTRTLKYYKGNMTIEDKERLINSKLIKPNADSHKSFNLKFEHNDGWYLKIYFGFSPRLSKSNGLVNQIFTRPFSLVVQKVVQLFKFRKADFFYANHRENFILSSYLDRNIKLFPNGS